MLYLIGDIHAQFKRLAVEIVVHGIRDSTLVQVGDFGAGFKRNEMEELEFINGFLGMMNNKLYVIRGNHDDPAYFFGKRKTGNIFFMDDYSVLDVENKKILLVGGAISIDRTDRVAGNSYWKEEAFVYDGEKLDRAIKDIDRLDIVVTHSAPSEFWPYGYGTNMHHFMERDDRLHADLANDRDGHSKLMKHLCYKNKKPTHWYYGHYHANFNADHGGIRYRALGIMRVYCHVG